MRPLSLGRPTQFLDVNYYYRSHTRSSGAGWGGGGGRKKHKYFCAGGVGARGAGRVGLEKIYQALRTSSHRKLSKQNISPNII